MISHRVLDLNHDISWGDLDPAKWRSLPSDEDESDDDEDVPAPAYVKAVLGFDPDTLFTSEEVANAATGTK